VSGIGTLARKLHRSPRHECKRHKAMSIELPGSETRPFRDLVVSGRIASESWPGQSRKSTWRWATILV